MKISIIYYSQSGNTEKIAQLIEEGIKQSSEIETKLINIKNEEEIDKEFIKESSTIIFGTPTYYASPCWQMKKWFDESKEYNLEGKLGSCFATENHLGGGADIALLEMVGFMMVKGMLIYSGGSALGQPYVHIGAVTIKDGDSMQQERAKIFGNRIAKKTLQIL